MRRLRAIGLIGTLLALTAACGSGDDDAAADEPTTAVSPTESPTPGPTETTEADQPTESSAASSAGELPSYDEVKALWLANTSDGDRTSCETKPTEDKKVGFGDGEYIRFVCAGITRFDYVVGADNYADNFAAATEDLTGRAVFHIPGEAYVKTSGANVDLAPAIRQACGCGEVVGPE